jgi:hypothetical protein
MKRRLKPKLQNGRNNQVDDLYFPEEMHAAGVRPLPRRNCRGWKKWEGAARPSTEAGNGSQRSNRGQAGPAIAKGQTALAALHQKLGNPPRGGPSLWIALDKVVQTLDTIRIIEGPHERRRISLEYPFFATFCVRIVEKGLDRQFVILYERIAQ